MNDVTRNRWQSLRQFTQARIALGRAGHAQPTEANLRFQWDHARARDAVHQPLNTSKLIEQLNHFGLPVVSVRSQAHDRSEYLRRPDLGRHLQKEDIDKLTVLAKPADVAITVAAGLSSTAVQNHAAALLRHLIPALQQAGLSLSLITVLTQGRVAIGDEIGKALGAKLSLVLIGERPGLSSPDSLGLYLTYAPAAGKTDAERNCISNIRPPQGQSYQQAVDTCLYLCLNALKQQISGVTLKDNSMTVEHNTVDRIPFLKDDGA